MSIGDLIYHNPLSSQRDLAGFRLEGDARVEFPNGRMRLSNVRDPAQGQIANFVFWCPEELPAEIMVTWEFTPLQEPGLAMMFFAARGSRGEDLFDPRLADRSGEYRHYTHGDIECYHASYFRRRRLDERAFHVCNLRKSSGFHLVATGADPIPDVTDVDPPYRMTLTKLGGDISLMINELPIFAWHDDAESYGPVLGSGKLGFRQMAPLVAEYANLEIHRIGS